jgi:GMP synthase (glutamine-hydrolysing)
MCHAFGARVERNPRGWELATRPVSLTAQGREDPLFEDMPDRFVAQMSHRDHVAELGTETCLLATNGHSTIQAVAMGDRVRAVQFHPEADETITRLFITTRAGALREEGLNPDKLCEQVTPAPLQERVLHNFEKNFVRRR